MILRARAVRHKLCKSTGPQVFNLLASVGSSLSWLPSVVFRRVLWVALIAQPVASLRVTFSNEVVGVTAFLDNGGSLYATAVTSRAPVLPVSIFCAAETHFTSLCMQLSMA
jgi:hypothetical protein